MASSRRLKLSEKLWVTGTVSLIGFLTFSPQLFIMLPYFRSLYVSEWASYAFASILPIEDAARAPAAPLISYAAWCAAATLLPFNLGVLAIFWNYYLAVTTDAGRVPEGWQPPWTAAHADHADDNSVLEVKRFRLVPRYCKVCQAYKPPRSHHCRTCKRCVLRMDHHCPWVANCVGHHNYGHFIRFLAAVDVTCVWHLVMISLRVADWWNTGDWQPPATPEMVLLIMNYALCGPVLLLVGGFSLYHFYCLANNTTTIEGWEKDKVSTLVRRGRIKEVKYPYYLSILANVSSILGPSPLMWCWPQPTPGDGLSYAVSASAAPEAQYIWPPKDPARPSQHEKHRFRLPDKAFTYGEGFNPALQPTNSTRRAAGTGAGPAAPGRELRQRQVFRTGDPDGDADGTARQGGAPPVEVDVDVEGSTISSLSEYTDSEGSRPGADAERALLHVEDTLDGLHADTDRASKEQLANKEFFPTLWRDEESASSLSSSSDVAAPRIRRGSEGYEVRPRYFVGDLAKEVARDGPKSPYELDEQDGDDDRLEWEVRRQWEAELQAERSWMEKEDRLRSAGAASVQDGPDGIGTPALPSEVMRWRDEMRQQHERLVNDEEQEGDLWGDGS